MTSRLGAVIDTSFLDAALDKAFEHLCDGQKTRAERDLKAVLGFPIEFKRSLLGEFTGYYTPELMGGPRITIDFPEQCARACYDDSTFDEWDTDSCRDAFKAVIAHEYIHYQQDYRSGGMFMRGYKSFDKTGFKPYRAQMVEIGAFGAMAARELLAADILGLAYPPQPDALNASATVTAYADQFDLSKPGDAKVLRRFTREVNLHLARAIEYGW